MIHLAVGLFALALTCGALVLVSLVAPDVVPRDPVFISGSIPAVVVSGVLVWYVRKERL